MPKASQDVRVSVGGLNSEVQTFGRRPRYAKCQLLVRIGAEIADATIKEEDVARGMLQPPLQILPQNEEDGHTGLVDSIDQRQND